MEPRRFLAAVSIAGFVVDGGPLRPVRLCLFEGDGRPTGMPFYEDVLELCFGIWIVLILFFWIFLMFFNFDRRYHSSYQGCAAINPGSFPTDFSFVVYRPYNRQCEFSRIG